MRGRYTELWLLLAITCGISVGVAPLAAAQTVAGTPFVAVAPAPAGKLDDEGPSVGNPRSARAAIETVVVVDALEHSLNLDRPSTAGSRLSLTPLDTPASVSVVSGNLVRDLGVGSVAQAKTLAPGITSFDTPGNGGNSFANRGFYGDNSVKQLYDGIEIYNAGSTLTFPFDSWNVDHIELLSGPGSVLYGTGAIGGAANVVPKRPQPMSQSTKVELSAGRFNTYHEAIDSTGPIGSSKLSYRADASHYGSDGFVDNAASDSIAVSASLRLDLYPNLFFILSDDYGSQHQSPYEGTPTLSGYPVSGLQTKNYNAQDVALNFVDNWTTLVGEWKPADNISVHNDLYYLTHHRRYHDIFGYQYVPATQTVKLSNFRDISANEHQSGDNGYVKYESTLFGNANSFLAGIDLNDNTYDRQDNSNVANGSYAGSATVNAFNFVQINYLQGSSLLYYPKYRTEVTQYGEFAEDRLTITDRISAVAGMRADHYQVDRKDLVVPATTDSGYNSTGYNLGVVYKPAADISLYGQYAVASDPVSSLSSISAAQQLFTLSKGKQGEIGAKASLWDHRLEGTIAAYRIVKTNLISPSPDNPAVSVQVGQQSSRGAEVSIAMRPSNAWRIEGNAAILKAQYDSFNTTVGGQIVSLNGYQPVNVPEQSANLRVFWDFAPQWQLRSAGQYVSRRFVDATDTTKLPGYVTLNLGLRWAATAQLKFDLRVDNALDKVYATASTSTTTWTLGQPRSVTLAVDLDF